MSTNATSTGLRFDVTMPIRTTVDAYVIDSQTLYGAPARAGRNFRASKRGPDGTLTWDWHATYEAAVDDCVTWLARVSGQTRDAVLAHIEASKKTA